jgi:hypothetical protein
LPNIRLVNDDGDILLEMDENEWSFVRGDLGCAEGLGLELEDETLALKNALKGY